MAEHIERASAWIYSGVWAGLTRLFLVPREAPSMPAGAHEVIGAFRPAPGSLRLSRMFFWIRLAMIGLGLLIAWSAITAAAPVAGAVLLIPALAIFIVPNLLGYVGIHLRYDTTWYVLTDRSMRLRRGVLHLTETTITYENVQNVTVAQGPIQRIFGISDLVVHTAGGGGGGAGGGGHGKHGGGSLSHLGRIVGVDNAPQIRDLIMDRVRASKSAGLGDEHGHAAAGEARTAPPGAWSAEHLTVLRQIRDALPRTA